MHLKEIDSRVEHAIKAIRANWFPPIQPTLTERQALSLRDSPFKGPLWISKVAFPVVDDEELRHIFLRAVTELGDGAVPFVLSGIDNVQAEWNGYRKSGDRKATTMSEQEAYGRLQLDTSSNVTVLYVHGGGYVLVSYHAAFAETLTVLYSVGNSSASRGIACALTERTGGRVCSVNYRLAPQNPFPAALYDVFIAYLSLLHPSHGSFHTPISASSIVLAGDSTGGALCLGLVQILRHLQLGKVTAISFNGSTVSLPSPAGVATLSAYSDHTDSLPSYNNTRNIDYSGQPPVYNEPGFPSCSIWPTNPPRAVAYCDGLALCHPLVSPVIAEDWSGTPPMWFACGEESVVDGCMVLASRAAEQRVSVFFEKFEGMPHIFPFLPGLRQLPQVKRCLKDWGDFCCNCVVEPDLLKGSKAVLFEYKTGQESLIELEAPGKIAFQEVKARMREKMMKMVESFQQRQRDRAKL